MSETLQAKAEAEVKRTGEAAMTAYNRELVFEELWIHYASSAAVQRFAEDADRAAVGFAMKEWLIANHDRMKAEILTP